MSLFSWYPHYVGDYQRKTSHLSILEHGAYRLLMDHYYSTGEPLPEDKKQMFRICRAFDGEEQEAIEKVLQLFFTHDAKAKVYTHKRIQKEIDKKHDISEKRAQAAKNKGKKRPAIAKQKQSKSKAKGDTSTSTSTSTNIQPQPEDYLTRIRALVSPEIWSDFEKHRKKKKADITETAMKGIEREALKAGWHIEDAIQELVMRGWVGFKAEWVNKGEENGNNKSAHAKMLAGIGSSYCE